MLISEIRGVVFSYNPLAQARSFADGYSDHASALKIQSLRLLPLSKAAGVSGGLTRHGIILNE